MSVDTVRFYVRRGLLAPSAGRLGGRHPYQEFGDADLDGATIIHTCQALGLSLREIAAFLADYRGNRLDDDSMAAYLRDQHDRLRRKAAELDRLLRFLDAKIGWVERGRTGPMPGVEDFALSTE